MCLLLNYLDHAIALENVLIPGAIELLFESSSGKVVLKGVSLIGDVSLCVDRSIVLGRQLQTYVPICDGILGRHRGIHFGEVEVARWLLFFLAGGVGVVIAISESLLVCSRNFAINTMQKVQSTAKAVEI